MNNLESNIRKAQNRLTASAKAMINASNEMVILRHQLRGQRNELSDNGLGIDPTGKVWKTKDYYVYAIRQGVDQKGRHIIYIQAQPAVGDLIITVAGTPTIAEHVKAAARTGVFSIVDTDVRRAPSGSIIYTKCICVPDRTGQWQDYSKTGDPLK